MVQQWLRVRPFQLYLALLHKFDDKIMAKSRTTISAGWLVGKINGLISGMFKQFAWLN